MKNNISTTMTDVKAWYGVEMVSLYEFLGRAAGSDLGKAVAMAAYQQNVPTTTHEVSNPKYTGKIQKYPKLFLIEYFKQNNQ